MKKVVFLLLLLPLVLFAQNESEAVQQPEPETAPQLGESASEGWSHSQVAIPSWIATGFSIGGLILNNFLASSDAVDYTTYYITTYGMEAATHVPLYFINPKQALWFSGAHALIIGGERALYGNDDYFRQYLSMANMHVGMHSVYAIYREARLKAGPDVYSDEWRKDSLGQRLSRMFPDDTMFNETCDHWEPNSFTDLFFAPVSKVNISDPFIWIMGISGILKTLIQTDKTDAIWNTGETYVGPYRMPGYVSIPLMAALYYLESSMVAMAEESVFRGFVYEEIGSRYGAIAGNVVDAVSFAAIHIPGEIAYDVAPGNIALNFVQRSALTLYLDVMYDRGGLERSVAAHAMIDFSILFAKWLCKGGAPQESFFDTVMAIPNLEIRFNIAI